MTAAQAHLHRAAGILLHPTSLPGPYGIGDLGAAAFAWVDMLGRAGQKWWQVLPLGPTGFGDSPYQCFSAFAGNPYLISPDELVKDSLLKPADLAGLRFPDAYVDYGPVIECKVNLLARAWENFKAGTAPVLRPLFKSFCAEHAVWLDDFALFMALKEAHGGSVWTTWAPALLAREPAALRRVRQELAREIGRQQFGQFLFFRQWCALKEYANARGVRLIGDVPIFVAHDSADVWAHPDLFYLDAQGQPAVVAGVPPDYFSATGQLWGNPLYRWKKLKQTGYAWWIERLRAILHMVDLIRLDHFRGFEAYWEIPAGRPTAEVGRWVKGPGAALLKAMHVALGDEAEWDGAALPLIAEDLGIVTVEMEALRDRFNLPGMKVLQFAWNGGPDDPFLPHTYPAHCVVYTGTHDNDTTLGWYAAAPEKERDFFRRYAGRDGHEVNWDFIRLAWASVANLAVAPAQDVLALGSEARMNFPGTAAGNWRWRFLPAQFTEVVLGRLGELTGLYGR